MVKNGTCVFLSLVLNMFLFWSFFSEIKADCTLKMKDEDCFKMMVGQLNAQTVSSFLLVDQGHVRDFKYYCMIG